MHRKQFELRLLITVRDIYTCLRQICEMELTHNAMVLQIEACYLHPR